MGNPVTRFREERGLSRAEFVRQAGVSYFSVSSAELGYVRQIPSSVRAGLARMGADAEAIQREYREWREQAAAVQA